MDTFDLIVIGAGPAGYHGAAIASQNGLKTAVITKENLGGVCLNEGCIPTKALLNSAKIFQYAKHGDRYGVTVTGAELSHEKVLARKNKVTKVLVAGVAAKLKKSGTTIIQGEATSIQKEGDHFVVSTQEQAYIAKYILIATGSQPFIPNIPGMQQAIERGFAVTSKEILNIKEIPARLTVIGGGVIGLEMAAYFATAGSKVTVIEMLPSIGGRLDQDICAILTKNLKKQGLDIFVNSTVTQIGENSVCYQNAAGETQEVPSDTVLVSVGRRAYYGSLLNDIELHTERGTIVTDDTMATSIKGIYAAGDVNGKSMLAHTAYREAEVAINNILGKEDTMCYDAVPAVIYTNPEVAFVGETEQSAAEKGIETTCISLPLRLSGRYIAEVEGGDGICKLVADKKTNTVIGAHIIGSYASEMIFAVAMMIELKTPISSLCKVIFPHPTVGEVIREGFFELSI